MPRSSNRALSFMPMRSEDPRWVSYHNNGVSSWSRGSEPPKDVVAFNGGYTATLPPPPRPPRLAALLDRADALGLSSSYYNKRDDKGDVQHFNCWRLRWCALCLVRLRNALSLSLQVPSCSVCVCVC